MRLNCVRLLVVPALAGMIFLGGCSGPHIQYNKIDYKSSGKQPPREIPPDLTAP
ncbi:MAG: hypothetical protein JNM82_01710, partial [Rhodocyclaceae bacterium]|nr:hypothetical protein [Rhodocyclaceae bacterium]